MSTELADRLKNLDLFKGVPEYVINRIADQTRSIELSKDDLLVKEGDPSDSLFVIRRGWVKIVTQGAAGNEVVLNQCGPGQIIGEMSLIDQLPRSNSIIALSPATLLEIKYSAIMESLNENPAFALSMLRDMSTRLRFANVYIEEAIQWCQQIAEGNYEFVEAQVERTQSTIMDMNKSHEARASAFLSSFFKMVKDIRRREENLKQQLQELTIQIDQAKKEQTVKELTDTSFFSELQAAAQKLRRKRTDLVDHPSEQDEAE
jgi:CRP-like cAMP-binding protein